MAAAIRTDPQKIETTRPFHVSSGSGKPGQMHTRRHRNGEPPRSSRSGIQGIAFSCFDSHR
jgi:hypothetical protein